VFPGEHHAPTAIAGWATTGRVGDANPVTIGLHGA
jgi:hypothetical protein